MLALSLTTICHADTNQPIESVAAAEHVFVEIMESGPRSGGPWGGRDESILVISKILAALGAWPCDTAIDEKFFDDFYEPYKTWGFWSKDVDSFFARCLDQNTISPKGPRPISVGNGMDDLVIWTQMHPVRLGTPSDGDTKVTIHVIWMDVGSYTVSNIGIGGTPIKQSMPNCEVQIIRPNSKPIIFRANHNADSSYDNWPIVNWAEDCGRFIVGLSKEFVSQASVNTDIKSLTNGVQGVAPYVAQEAPSGER